MASLKSKYPLIIGKDQSVLRTICTPITDITPTIHKLAKAMELLVHEYDWVWLAAPQLWYTIRMIATTQRKIIKWQYKLKSTIIMINPEIISHSDSTQLDEEGCLSLPWMFGQVSRYKQITVQYTTVKWSNTTLQLSDLDAIIVQHEIDHLDGILFIDRCAKVTTKSVLT